MGAPKYQKLWGKDKDERPSQSEDQQIDQAIIKEQVKRINEMIHKDIGLQKKAALIITELLKQKPK